MTKPFLSALLLLFLATFFACQKDEEAPPCSSGQEAALDSILVQLKRGDISADTAIRQLSFLRPGLDTCESRKKDSLLASVSDEAGKNLLFVAGRMVDSEFYSQEALKIRKRLFGDPYHRDIMRMYYNIGIANLHRGNYHQAISYFDSASSRPVADLSRLFILSKLRLGQAYQEIGELNNALFHYQVAVDSIAVRSGSEAKRLELIRSIASCYRLLGEYDKGIGKVDEVLNHDGLDAEEADLADLYLVLGNIWQDSLLNADGQEARRQAETYTQMALSLYEKLPEGPAKELRIAIAAGNLGELYRRMGRHSKAADVLTGAIGSLEAQDSEEELFVQLYINRGEAYFNQKKYKAALADYDRALSTLVPAYLRDKVSALPPVHSYSADRQSSMVLLADIAQAHLKLFEEEKGNARYLEKAVAAYDTLYQLINLVRGDFISDEAKLGLAAASRDILGKAFQGCLKLYQMDRDPRYKEQAFQISEQSKAFVLLEAARLKNVSSMLPEAMRQSEEKLLQERAELESQLLEAWNDPDERKKVEKGLARNFGQILAFQRQLGEEYPNYHALKYEGANLTSDDIRRDVLGEGQTLVEYFQQDSSLHIFLLTPDGLEWQSVPIVKAELDLKLARFRELLEQGKPGDTIQVTEFCRLGHELYKYLLSPVEHKLTERLVIIPAGALNTLPFEALLKRKPISGTLEQARQRNFALYSHSISYCFSANLLALMQSGKESPGRRRGVAIFASTFNTGLSANAASARLPSALNKALRYLTPLGINQDEEVKKIEDNIRGAVAFKGEEATKEAFFSACRKYSAVHIPTHGILNEKDPGYSFISFSQMSRQVDLSQLLFVKDLYAHHWGLDLIFLSACQTASGRFMEGEGNISLARGMAYAGVRSLATTLWNVPTAEKSKIAPAFYVHYLNEGQPKDVALAKAKRDAALKCHPQGWAGLILIGAAE